MKKNISNITLGLLFIAVCGSCLLFVLFFAGFSQPISIAGFMDCIFKSASMFSLALASKVLGDFIVAFSEYYC